MKKTSSSTRIFIVEDNPIDIKMAKYALEMDPDYDIHIFTTGKECLSNLHLKPSIISLDYSLPDINGHEILQKIKAHNKDIEVIMLSGQGDIDTAVQLLKDGAYDYIVKNDDTIDRLMHTLQRLKSNIKLKKKVEELEEELGEKYAFNKTIIGNSAPMQAVFKLLKKAVRTNISVTISGETGTGKELVAKSIHFNSERRKGNFVAVNVSAIPSELLESELFGYEKGAFTGANTRKPGQFELANNGTLFLDEIGDMDMNLQAKILRALQEREIVRLGGTEKIKFETRVIVATHKNLAEEVEKGNFREDLYYRLLGLPILLPPLRNRGNDIILLMRHFLNDFCKKNNLNRISLDTSAKEKLLSYNYPGNVRELKAIIELAAVMAEDDLIEEETIKFNSPKKVESFFNLELPLKEYNRKIIFHFLEKYNRDVLLVAKKLDIGKSTIYRLLKEESH